MFSSLPGAGETFLSPSRSKIAQARLARLLLSVLFAGAPAARAQTPAKYGVGPAKAAPPVEEIVKKAIERGKWDDEQKLDARYTYTQRSTVEELDSGERVKKHEERLLFVLPIEGESYARLIEKDGKPLSEKDARLEKERERKFRQRQAEKRRRREQGQRDDGDIEITEELANKYRFTLIGNEPVNGRPAYVLSLEPRSNDLPVRRRLDRLLNKVAGRVWIDEQDFEISRADLHLAEDVSAWGGVLASLRKFLLRVDQTKVDETVWLPRYVDAYFDGRILVKTFHMKVQQQNSDFHRIGGGPLGSSQQ